jgi:hypothetical protein
MDMLKTTKHFLGLLNMLNHIVKIHILQSVTKYALQSFLFAACNILNCEKNY